MRNIAAAGVMVAATAGGGGDERQIIAVDGAPDNMRNVGQPILGGGAQRPAARKTKLCVNTFRGITCAFGDHCRYAHSVDEIRDETPRANFVDLMVGIQSQLAALMTVYESGHPQAATATTTGIATTVGPMAATSGGLGGVNDIPAEQEVPAIEIMVRNTCLTCRPSEGRGARRRARSL